MSCLWLFFRVERVEKVDVVVEEDSSEEEEEEPINLLHRVELSKQEPHGFGLDVGKTT